VEIKQKDKQREELLMKLKVSVMSKFARGHRAEIHSWVLVGRPWL